MSRPHPNRRAQQLHHYIRLDWRSARAAASTSIEVRSERPACATPHRVAATIRLRGPAGETIRKAGWPSAAPRSFRGAVGIAHPSPNRASPKVLPRRQPNDAHHLGTTSTSAPPSSPASGMQLRARPDRTRVSSLLLVSPLARETRLSGRNALPTSQSRPCGQTEHDSAQFERRPV